MPLSTRPQALLLADAWYQAAEVPSPLPLSFAAGNYGQIVTDMAERLMPELGAPAPSH